MLKELWFKGCVCGLAEDEHMISAIRNEDGTVLIACTNFGGDGLLLTFEEFKARSAQITVLSNRECWKMAYRLARALVHHAEVLVHFADVGPRKISLGGGQQFFTVGATA